jgi:uroporphyrinogen decarboxylase
MNKRDAILSFADPQAVQTYVPAAFFLHFPEQYHAGQAAVDKHVEYFRATGMDFVKIQFETRFPVLPQIQSPSDWAQMPRYGLDFYAGQLDAVKGIVQALRGEAVVVMTLYSPFMMAGQTATMPRLIEHLNSDPAAVRKGLEIITDSLLGFARECAFLGVDGFYTSTQGGETGRLADSGTFASSIKPYDLALMNEANRICSFNILHVCDYHLDYASFEPFLEYPGAVVNTPLKAGGNALTPKEVSAMFKRPYMGGLERKGVILNGTPSDIRLAVESVIAQAPPRFILGADCTVLDHTPWQNLKIAIDAAHEISR